MDFLNHRNGGMVFYQVFLLSPLQCTVIESQKYVRGCMSLNKYVRGCLSLKKYKSQGEAVYVTSNSKDFCLDFRPRIRPLYLVMAKRAEDVKNQVGAVESVHKYRTHRCIHNFPVCSSHSQMQYYTVYYTPTPPPPPTASSQKKKLPDGQVYTG